MTTYIIKLYLKSASCCFLFFLALLEMNLYLADAIEISTLYLMLPLIALAFYLFTASAFKDTESLPVEVSGLTITLSLWTVILPRFKLEGFSTMVDSYIYILQNWITNLFF